MVDAQDAHVGAAPRAALLDRLGGGVEDLHERDRPATPCPLVDATRSPAGRRRENAKPVPPPVCWMIAAHLTASKMPVDGVVDGQHEAGGELAERAAGVHERRRVGQEVERRHPLRVARGVVGARRDVARDPLEHLVGRLDHTIAVAPQVAAREYGLRVLRQTHRQHRSTHIGPENLPARHLDAKLVRRCPDRSGSSRATPSPRRSRSGPTAAGRRDAAGPRTCRAAESARSSTPRSRPAAPSTSSSRSCSTKVGPRNRSHYRRAWSGARICDGHQVGLAFQGLAAGQREYLELFLRYLEDGAHARRAAGGGDDDPFGT